MAVKALMNVLLMVHICVGLYVAVKTAIQVNFQMNNTEDCSMNRLVIVLTCYVFVSKCHHMTLFIILWK